MIPNTRPVIGDDLVTLRDRLGLGSGDACWFYATSMTKWAKMTGNARSDASPIPGSKLPVPDPTLALMVRVLDANITASALPPPAPTPSDLFAMINEIRETTRKAFVVMFGAEASSGYRWVVAGRKIGPSLERLFTVFTTLFNEAKAESRARAELFLQDWDQMVLLEGKRRGIEDVFKAGRWTVENEPQPGLDRPITGEDLDALKERLKMSTQDACWLFGMPVNRWMIVARNPGRIRIVGGKERYQAGAKDPVSNASLALLVRVLRKRPDASPLPQAVPAEHVFKTLLQIRPETDKKRFSILFGSEASSGYRWLKRGIISAPVARLFKVFMTLVAPDGEIQHAHSVRVLKAWEKMVEVEAKARGVHDIFKAGRWSIPAPAEDDIANRKTSSTSGSKAAAGKRKPRRTATPIGEDTRAAAKTIARAVGAAA
jgi:hypothetical protein